MKDTILEMTDAKPIICAICNQPSSEFVIDMRKRRVCKVCHERNVKLAIWLRESDERDARDEIAMDGHYDPFQF